LSSAVDDDVDSAVDDDDSRSGDFVPGQP